MDNKNCMDTGEDGKLISQLVSVEGTYTYYLIYKPGHYDVCSYRVYSILLLYDGLIYSYLAPA